MCNSRFAVVQLVCNCLLSSHWIHLVYSPPLFHPQLHTQRDWPLLSHLFWMVPALSLLVSGAFSDHRRPSLSLHRGAQHWAQPSSWEQWWLHSVGKQTMALLMQPRTTLSISSKEEHIAGSGSSWAGFTWKWCVVSATNSGKTASFSRQRLNLGEA